MYGQYVFVTTHDVEVGSVYGCWEAKSVASSKT